MAKYPLIFQRAVIARPGVVDQDVESAESLGYLGGQGLPVCWRSDVAGHCDRVELTGQLLQAVRAPGRHHNIGACFGQHPCKPLPQA